MPNVNVSHSKRFEANARPGDLKFGAHGTTQSIAAQAGGPRTQQASDSEDESLGREQARKLKADVKGCIRKVLNHVASPPAII